MARGRDAHHARLAAISRLGKTLTRRAGSVCELCADSLDLRKDIQLNTRIERADFLEEERIWRVTTDGGDSWHNADNGMRAPIDCDWCIFAEPAIWFTDHNNTIQTQ